MKLLIFVAFVILYSVYLCCILVNENENDTDKVCQNSTSGKTEDIIDMDTINQEQDNSTIANIVVSMIGNINKDGITAIRIMLGILLTILSVEELCQANTIGLQYFQQMENYIEWSTIICAVTAITNDTLEKCTNDIVRGFSAIGICLAYLELIFLTGRYPFKWCDFGIMFYRILTRLLRYVFALLLIIIGHTFAFTVNMHTLDAFKSPWKNFLETLTRFIKIKKGRFVFDIFKIFFYLEPSENFKKSSFMIQSKMKKPREFLLRSFLSP